MMLNNYMRIELLNWSLAKRNNNTYGSKVMGYAVKTFFY